MNQWITIAKIGEIPIGGLKAVSIQGIPIAVFNLKGEYFAILNRCTHQDYPLSEGHIIEDQITCPLHGARFNIKTGEVTAPPAFIDVDTFEVRIVEENIQIKLP